MSERKQVVIDSAGALFAALQSPDLGEAIGIVRAIAQDPAGALRLGEHHGQDVVDFLVHQAYQRQGVTYQQLLFGALAAFDDPRVVDFFGKAVSAFDSPQLAQIAAQRLGREPIETVERALKPLLRDERRREHCAQAADVLVASRTLTPWEAIRVSVANRKGVDLGVPVDASTVPAWAEEMAGWYGPQTRALIETRGVEAYRAVVAAWDRLDSESRLWAIRFGVHAHAIDSVEPVRKGLEDRDPDVVRIALDGVARLDPNGVLFAASLGPLLDHDDPGVRAGALRAGARPSDLSERLEREKDPEVRAALCARLGDQGEARPLLPLLASDDWRERAAATQGLVRCGPTAIPALRERLLGAGSVGERTAAAQALVELGDIEWLEENLLSFDGTPHSSPA